MIYGRTHIEMQCFQKVKKFLGGCFQKVDWKKEDYLLFLHGFNSHFGKYIVLKNCKRWNISYFMIFKIFM